MNLIDTHAHLYWDLFESDLNAVIQRSIDAGVTTIINVGVDVKLSKKALQQVQDKLANISGLTAYSTIGIHPHESVKYSLQKDIDNLEQIYKSNRTKVVAVGECGLDYLFDPKFTPTLSITQIKNLQKKLFQAQINLAKKINLPLLVHCRDDRSQDPQNCEAWNEVLQLIGNHPAILHCYSGLPHTTNYLLPTTNFLVSFAANITYPKNEYLREAVKALPLERICLETDCPFLAPQSKRGQRNEPANVLEIAQLIAELKHVTLEKVANQTTENVKTLLKLT
ncbi:TatD family hydrolase [Candidatus Daviesbacteria bacterium]|nr:TatD family hydrolase [Candidatus Daviesbacteria bacterium]